MATTKLGNTKSASRAINYAEKRAEIKSGLNCDVDYAKSSFKATRELFNKNQGVQAHTIIQSFKPGEIEPEKANELGRELAERVAGDYQVGIYTHTDKDHIHNHIVINSLNLETGNKYQSNAKQRNQIKEQNDEVCREHGLSVPVKDSAKEKYTQAEKEMVEKGQSSWKDEIREVVDMVRDQVATFDEFKNRLSEYEIDFKVRGKNVTYKHPDVNKKVRGSKLGANYDKGGLECGFERQNQRGKDQSKSRDNRENRYSERKRSQSYPQSENTATQSDRNQGNIRKTKRANKQDGPELEL